MKLLRTVFAVLLLLGAFNARAGLPVEDYTGMAGLDLHVGVLEDPQGRMTLRDVLTANADNRFTQILGNFNAGFTDSAYWFRISVRSPESARLFLEIADAAIDDLRFYQEGEDGLWHESRAGFAYPFAQRPKPYPTVAFPFTVKAQSLDTVYLRASTRVSLVLPLVLWSEETYAQGMQTEGLIHAVYYGIILAMLVYNGFLWLVLREKAYLAYTASTLGALLTISVLSGHAYQFLWPGSPLVAGLSLAVVPAAWSLASLWFTRVFLDLRRTAPRFDLVLKIIFMAILGCYVVLAVAGVGAASRTFNTLLLPALLAMMVSGVMLFLRGYRPARFFVAGFCFLLAGAIVSNLKVLGVVPPNLFTVNAIAMGSALEVLLFALALAERIQNLREERQKAVEQALAEETRRLEHERVLAHQSRLAAMGEMIGHIAHQWRQPLTALSLSLDTIADANNYDDLEKAWLDETLVDAQGLVKRMSGTIDDFRNFFNPQKVRVSFSLKAVVENTLGLLSGYFGKLGVEVSLSGGDEVTAVGVANEYGHAVLNLLSNAADVIHERNVSPGKVWVDIRREGGMACLTVTDNAGGVPRDILPRVFEPYFTTKGEKGTGVGLYMTKVIMDAMDGSVTAENVVGGARFTLRLPAETENS